MQINKPKIGGHLTGGLTHEGAGTYKLTPEQELRRSVMACMLWEGTFYESGQSVADRIRHLVPQVRADIVRDMAIEARDQMNLRHVPLLLLRELARTGQDYEQALWQCIKRPDEMGEFLSIYWKDGKCPIPAQVKRAFRNAFRNFDAYQIAKWKGETKAITLRDVMFLVHPNPNLLGAPMQECYGALANGTLVSPGTWEDRLSGGEDPKDVWEDLLVRDKLGGMALLRNLRNMDKVKVSEDLITEALVRMSVRRILPYRFVAAAKFSDPKWEPVLEQTMLRCIRERDVPLQGKTAIVVDNSASMNWDMSEKSKLKRKDAACALAMIAREMCDEDPVVISFSNEPKVIPARHGFALKDAIQNAMRPSGTYLRAATGLANSRGYERIIVITDEQAHPGWGSTLVSRTGYQRYRGVPVPYVSSLGSRGIEDPLPGSKAYCINVGTYQNGVAYGPWTHIDGFSAATLDYITTMEDVGLLGTSD
jgi:hypothetical protein